MTPVFGGIRGFHRQILKQRFLLVQNLGVSSSNGLCSRAEAGRTATWPVFRSGANSPQPTDFRAARAEPLERPVKDCAILGGKYFLEAGARARIYGIGSKLKTADTDSFFDRITECGGLAEHDDLLFTLLWRRHGRHFIDRGIDRQLHRGVIWGTFIRRAWAQADHVSRQYLVDHRLFDRGFGELAINDQSSVGVCRLLISACRWVAI